MHVGKPIPLAGVQKRQLAAAETKAEERITLYIPDKASAVSNGDHGIALLSVLMCVYFFDAENLPVVPRLRFFTAQ
jgi:hypothetical protein